MSKRSKIVKRQRYHLERYDGRILSDDPDMRLDGRGKIYGVVARKETARRWRRGQSVQSCRITVAMKMAKKYPRGWTLQQVIKERFLE